MVRRKTEGISTVLGTLFFILIAFLILSSALLIFNSFNDYTNTFRKQNNVDIRNKEVSLSLANLAFGGVASLPVINFQLSSLPNNGLRALYPITNMNFTQNMNGWFFTRTYLPTLPADCASISNSPLNTMSGNIVFTLQITNCKNSPNDIATVTLNVDSRFILPATQSAPSGWTVSVSGNTITWTSATKGGGKFQNDLDGGDSQTFTWTATVPAVLGQYTHTVTPSWVSGDSLPFVDSGTSGIITNVVSSNPGSTSSVQVKATQVPGAGGANGGYDPTTPIGSQSGPGSLYILFQPTIGGIPISQQQQLTAIMNFTTSFTLDASTASNIVSSSAKLSWAYSMDQLVSKSKSLVLVSVYMIQESTGKQFLIDQRDPTLVASGNPTGWLSNTGILLPPAISWAAGKYDLVLSVTSTLQGANPGSNNYPATLLLHFDDIGIALALSSTTFYTDSWSQNGAFIISTGQTPMSVTGIDISVSATTTKGPVNMYLYLNDFSRGSTSSPFWVLFNQTTFSSVATVSFHVPSSSARLYVDQQGRIFLRVYSISASSFNLATSVATVSKSSDQTKVALSVANSSPFAVHLVSLYISGQGNLTHFDVTYSKSPPNGVSCYQAGSCKFDIWVGPGESLSLSLHFNWLSGQAYTVVVGTDNGLLFTKSFQS